MTPTERDELLIRTATICDDMHIRLFGNGQPGELDRIRVDHDLLKAWKNKITGALLFLSAMTTALGGVFFAHIFRTSK